LGPKPCRPGESSFDVAAFCINPGYMIAGLHQENDIALIKLKEPVDVATAGLPSEATQTAMFAFTHNATISGWGQTGPSAQGSDQLLFGTVQVMVNNATCDPSYPGNQITPGMICATSSVADTCYGDSGGPLIMRTRDKAEFVEGVTSWAAGPCGQGIPSVYTRVPGYSPWIGQVTGIPIPKT
jgi:secreted trypsin-like serine protease